MKKRFSQIVCSALMAFTMIMPIFSTAAFAQADGSTGTGTGYGASGRWRSFNRQMAAINPLAVQATTTLGDNRYLRLLSAYLGVPIQVINGQFQISGVPMADFTVAAIIADLSGVPLQNIVNQMTGGMTLAQIIANLNANGNNVTINLIVVSLKDFQAILADAIGNANVGTNPDLAPFVFDLTRFNVNFEANFNRFARILGEGPFRAVVFQRLSAETGVPVAEIERQYELSQLYIPQLSSFTEQFLLRGMLIAVDGPFDRIDFNLPALSMSQIAQLLISEDIPVELFLRVGSAFARQLTTTGNPRSRDDMTVLNGAN